MLITLTWAGLSLLKVALCQHNKTMHALREAQAQGRFNV